MKYEYEPNGVCSIKMIYEIEGDTLVDVKIIGGCAGNTLGVSKLVAGMKIDDVIKTLKGIQCGFKSTSCPDQLARGLEKYKEEHSEEGLAC